MNTPTIRVVGPSGSGRSAIAAALYRLLNASGVTSELINCAVDEQSWRIDLKALMRGKMLPIIVSPNRPGERVPPVMEFMTDLAAARKSAQDQHKKCQSLEKQLAEVEKLLASVAKDNGAWNEGYRSAGRAWEKRIKNIREELQKEFDSKLASYKDATRSELKALRFGVCPDTYMAVHRPEEGKSSPHIILSYHHPTVAEVRSICGFPEGGKVTCTPVLAPLVPSKTT
jgi:hypothetical protein